MLRFKEIRRSVEELLREKSVRRPPVPIEKLAGAVGLRISYAPADDEVSGALIRTAKETVIGVNSRHHANRRRFTIAHELGHFRLHRGVAVHVDEDFRVNLRDEKSSEGVDWEEVEANRFAAELLMPTSFLLRDVETFKNIDSRAIRLLAARYQVSAHAMEIRLANLGLAPRV